MVKKKIYSLLVVLMLSALLAGCGNTGSSSNSVPDQTDTASAEKLKVVTTIFPQYDIVRELAGDNVELTMLLAPGAESHSYDPSPQDIITIQNCDVFIYVGGESDDWVDQILNSMDTSNMKIISLMDLVDVVEEELVEGMEAGHNHSHGHSHGDEDFDDEDVKDRPLSDWAGEWQSVYSYLLDGTLDEVMARKAEENADMSFDDYIDYYTTGYETDAEKIIITGDTIEFIRNGASVKAVYEYEGYEILTYESGSRGVRYLFSAAGADSRAPRSVQFSDHIIAPEESEHFHIYFGEEAHQVLLQEEENWPTYYPAALDGKEIAADMLGHHHDDDHEDDDYEHEEAEHEEAEYDEHVWTSPKNAQIMVQSIMETLCELDPENSEGYQANAEAYTGLLEELDEAFREMTAGAVRNTIMVGDRFPFRYLADEYGLNYYAAFSGCSNSTDASAGTLAFLIDKTIEEEIPVVFHIELSNERITDTICEGSGAEKLLLHSCHNVTRDDFTNGVGYLDLMWQNIESLRAALY